jgi:hypothetical protein
MPVILLGSPLPFRRTPVRACRPTSNSRSSRTTSDAELQERVRKLLAMANDESASTQERKVAQAKAEGLLAELLAGRPVPS